MVISTKLPIVKDLIEIIIHVCTDVPEEIKVRDGQTSPHRPRLVVSRSTCLPLSSPPHANSFVRGPAVIKHTLAHQEEEEEEDSEEEEDLFVFNDTIEGPRAPVVKPDLITQGEVRNLN